MKEAYPEIWNSMENNPRLQVKKLLFNALRGKNITTEWDKKIDRVQTLIDYVNAFHISKNFEFRNLADITVSSFELMHLSAQLVENLIKNRVYVYNTEESLNEYLERIETTIIEPLDAYKDDLENWINSFNIILADNHIKTTYHCETDNGLQRYMAEADIIHSFFEENYDEFVALDGFDIDGILNEIAILSTHSITRTANIPGLNAAWTEENKNIKEIAHIISSLQTEGASNIKIVSEIANLLGFAQPVIEEPTTFQRFKRYIKSLTFPTNKNI